MDKNKIVFTLQNASLFRDDDLYNINNVTVQEEQDLSISTIVFLNDDNLKNVQEMEFLKKILAACRISENSIKYTSNKISWKNIALVYPNVMNVFLFGININELGVNLNLPVYFTTMYDNKRIIMAEPIHKLSVDNKAKSFYWKEILQPIFG